MKIKARDLSLAALALFGGLSCLGLSAHAQSFVYVANSSDGTVSVISAAANAVVATIHVGASPQGVAITPDGSRAYVTNGGDGTVSVIDTAHNSVITDVVVGSAPGGIAAAPGGAYVYVANGGSNNVSIIATATNMVVATVTINVPSGPAGPNDVIASPDGAFVYVVDYQYVSVIATGSWTVESTLSVPAGNGSTNGPGVAISPDGTLLYVCGGEGNIAVIGTNPLSVVGVVATNNNTRGSETSGVTITPDGKTGYAVVGGFNELAVFDPKSYLLSLPLIPIGNGGPTWPHALAVTRDGAYLYIPNYLAGTVSVVSTATPAGAIVATVGVGNGPGLYEIAITPPEYANFVVNPLSFGDVLVGASVSGQITYRFTSPVTLSGVSIVTQGAPNLDYIAASGGTCAAGTYSAGQTCTVNVTFAPTEPGQRSGAVELLDGGAPILAAYLVGTGLAPQPAIVSGVIGTVAGSGVQGESGDGGTATAANLDYPIDVAVDGIGNLYIAENHTNVRMVSAATGAITTVAGNGTRGFSGDGGPATSAQLFGPQGVAVDAQGNIFIADTFNSRIREVNAATRMITTVAGGGNGCPEQTDAVGDGCQATSAELAHPQGFAVDAVGNLYIADNLNFILRKVSAATGVITAIAGNGIRGYSGDGGPASGAEIDQAQGVTVDATGNVYITDTPNQRVRKISAATGAISTIVGNGIAGYSGDGGQANTAELDQPAGKIGVDAAGDVYIADLGNQRIRKVSQVTGVITTIAGNGTAGYGGDGGTANGALLDGPAGVTLDAGGNLYIADYGNQRVRFVSVSAAPLTFPPTEVGATSATQTFSLANDGNLPLSETGLSAGQNFAVDGSATTCTTSSSLPPGSSCLIGALFAPDSLVPLQGAVTITDNALNLPGTTQLVALNGSAVAQQSQTVTFPSLPNPLSLGSGALTLNATASSGLTVSYAVTGPAILLGSTLTVTGTGTVVVTASQAGDADYLAATPVSQTITVNSAAQTISFPALPGSISYGSAPLAVNATASSGLAVSYTVTGPAALSGSTLTVTGAGTVVVTASQAGDADYLAATPVSQTVTVNPEAQRIAFSAVVTPAFDGNPVTIPLNATASSGLPVVFSASGAGAINAGDTALIVTGAGSVTVTANVVQASSNFLPAVPVTQTLTVVPGYGWGLYATSADCSALTMLGASSIDSFNSNLGSYATTHTPSGGNVGTNGSAALSGKAVVYGALYDPNGNVTQSASCSSSSLATGSDSTAGAATIQGGVIALPAALSFTPPTAPNPAPSGVTQTLGPGCNGVTGCTPVSPGVIAIAPGAYGNLSVGSNMQVNVSAGTYNLNSLLIGDKSILHLTSGPVIMNVAGAGQAVVIAFSGSAYIDNTLTEANLLILYAGTGQLSMTGGSTTAAEIYAPQAAVTISGNADFFGSVIAGTIELNGNVAVHYDQALGAVPAGMSVGGNQP